MSQLLPNTIIPLNIKKKNIVVPVSITGKVSYNVFCCHQRDLGLEPPLTLKPNQYIIL